MNIDEEILSTKCNNGGLVYLDDKLQFEKIQCYGYDFTNCYETFLSMMNISKLMIPTKVGKYDNIEVNIFAADKLPYGLHDTNRINK